VIVDCDATAATGAFFTPTHAQVGDKEKLRSCPHGKAGEGLGELLGIHQRLLRSFPNTVTI
jgi:hypothetical protein